MTRSVRTPLALVLSTIVCLWFSVIPASAQFIGTFSWQTQPFCNRITVNVTQAGNAYILEGHDNLCGAVRRAPVTGTATLNPDGTVGLGLTVVNRHEQPAQHVEAVVDLGTLGGTWSDSAGNSGAWVFNGEGGGDARPVNVVHHTAFGVNGVHIIGRAALGTPEEPLQVGFGVSTLLRLAGRGFASGNVGFVDADRVAITFAGTEQWGPNAQGTRMDFWTTANGSSSLALRMRIHHNGRVGIGIASPAQQLDVDGNVRVGAEAGLLGCVEDRDGTLLTGNCASDARFKRDVVSFEPMLNKVAALRPVHFYWRADEFPSRAFGARQSYGLMAQEVEEVLPELVTTDAEGFKAVNYSKLPLMALQAIRELKAKNDALEAQNAAIEAQNAAIERRLAELEARLKP